MADKIIEPICEKCKKEEKKRGKPLPIKYCSRRGEELPVPPTFLQRLVLFVRGLVFGFAYAVLGFLVIFAYLALFSSTNSIVFAYVGCFFGLIKGFDIGSHPKKKPKEKKPEGQAGK